MSDNVVPYVTREYYIRKKDLTQEQLDTNWDELERRMQNHFLNKAREILDSHIVWIGTLDEKT